MFPVEDLDITLEEVKRKVFSAKPWKAPGRDGLPAVVWRQLWPVVQEEILDLFKALLDEGNLANPITDAPRHGDLFLFWPLWVRYLRLSWQRGYHMWPRSITFFRRTILAPDQGGLQNRHLSCSRKASIKAGEADRCSV